MRPRKNRTHKIISLHADIVGHRSKPLPLFLYVENIHNLFNILSILLEMRFIKYRYDLTSELAPQIVSVYGMLSLAVGRKYIFCLYIKVSTEVLLVTHPCVKPRRKP